MPPPSVRVRVWIRIWVSFRVGGGRGCHFWFRAIVLEPMKKIYFFHGRKKRRFFPYIHDEIIFCCAELFESAFNFKFCWNIFVFLNINTNLCKKHPLILGAAVERCCGSICLEVNCQACNFTLRAFLRILVTSFWPVLKNLSKF